MVRLLKYIDRSYNFIKRKDGQKMKRIVRLIAVVAALVCLLTGSACAEEWWKDYQDSTDIKTFTERPGIKGSSAYDITVSLKNMGKNVPGRESDSDGYHWSFSFIDGGTNCSVDLVTNKKYEISYATFSMIGKNNGFLYFAATMPYEGKKDNSAAEWVEKNLNTKEEITRQDGDIIYKLTPMPNGNGWTLDIEHVDYPDYLIYSMSKQ